MTYGKFASAEELLKGYNELEKSFTQKCQQLAALKAEATAQVGGNGQTAAFQTLSDAAAQLLETSVSDAAVEKSAETAHIAQTDTDGTNAAASPSEAERSTTVDSAETVPQSGLDAPDLSGRASASQNFPSDPIALLQQFLQNNSQAVLQLLRQTQSTFAPPTVMSGGGNVSMAAPSRPKTIKEASLMAKELFK